MTKAQVKEEVIKLLKKHYSIPPGRHKSRHKFNEAYKGKIIETSEWLWEMGKDSDELLEFCIIDTADQIIECCPKKIQKLIITLLKESNNA